MHLFGPARIIGTGPPMQLLALVSNRVYAFSVKCTDIGYVFLSIIVTVFTEECSGSTVRWESVKCFICGLGKLNFLHILYICSRC